MTDTMDQGSMTAMATMRVISQDKLGGPNVLKQITAPTPDPGLSEVRVRVHAAGVNPIDAINRETGAYLGEPPFVLGWDVCGAVDAVGLGVTKFQPGDEVFGMLPFPQGHGAYADYVVAPTRVFARRPESLDHVHAAAVPMVGLTAWQALVDSAGVGEGTRVLVVGASGGIGHLAVQIAKARGAYVIGLTSGANVEFVSSLGADEVIDREASDFTEKVGDLDVVLDVVGEDYPGRALKVLKPGGVLVSTQPPSLESVGDEAGQRGVRLAGMVVEADGGSMAALADLADAGQLTPTIAATYPLEEVAEAQAAEHGPGKVVLTLE
jgi:NADPH:quinone reductase-like Zn-dependent oxidoreductase